MGDSELIAFGFCSHCRTFPQKKKKKKNPLVSWLRLKERDPPVTPFILSSTILKNPNHPECGMPINYAKKVRTG